MYSTNIPLQNQDLLSTYQKNELYYGTMIFMVFFSIYAIFQYHNKTSVFNIIFIIFISIIFFVLSYYLSKVLSNLIYTY